MSINQIVVCALLIMGVLGFLTTSIGLLLNDDLYDQIHFLSPGSLIGSVAIPAAVLVQEGFSQAATKAILIAILLFFSNPVLSHATARAGRIRRKQKLAPEEKETTKLLQEEA
jgi:monovalent cation/proton antiporter MnhG/PhaG subunit